MLGIEGPVLAILRRALCFQTKPRVPTRRVVPASNHVCADFHEFDTAPGLSP